MGVAACASTDLHTPSTSSVPRSSSSSIWSAVSVKSLPTGKIISPSAVCIGKPTAIPCCRSRWTALTISSALSAKLFTTSSLKRHHCGNGGASLGGQDGLHRFPTASPRPALSVKYEVQSRFLSDQQLTDAKQWLRKRRS